MAGAAAGAGAFSGFERTVAWRYLRPRRKEAFISVIALISFVGIMLGVMALVVVMSVMNGFRAELLTRILGINGHILVEPMDSPLEDYDAVAARIAGVPGIRYAIPLIQGQTLVSGPIGRDQGALVRGVREADLKRIDLVAGNLKGGTLEGFDGSEGVAIGTGMARAMGLAVGEPITLISPEGDTTAFGTTPRIKAYPVIAIFEIGMSEYDNSVIFMPLAEAQPYFNLDGIVQSIEVSVADPDAVDAVKPLVADAARRSVYLSDWRQQNRSYFSALDVERNVMFMILTLIVLVAALNIISGLVMLVKDKSADIAILRTMGASRGSILRIFIMTGSVIGVVGTLAGVGLGLVICLNIESIRQFFTWVSGTKIFDPEFYFLSQLPAKVDPRETAYVVLMALGLSFLATIFPAWRAARLDPVQALRYE